MDDLKAPRPLAVVTGASSGIGYHLALLAAQHGHDRVVAADRPLEQPIAGPTDTDFFERAHMTGTRAGARMKKDDPSYVARIGFDAMLQGEGDVVSGWRNKAQVLASKALPAQTVAQVHRKIAEPDSRKEEHATTTHEHPRMERKP